MPVAANLNIARFPIVPDTKLQDAGNRFWLLLVAQGVEDWVQR